MTDRPVIATAKRNQHFIPTAPDPEHTGRFVSVSARYGPDGFGWRRQNHCGLNYRYQMVTSEPAYPNRSRCHTHTRQVNASQRCDPQEPVANLLQLSINRSFLPIIDNVLTSRCSPIGTADTKRGLAVGTSWSLVYSGSEHIP